MQQFVDKYNKLAQSESIECILQKISSDFPNQAVFTTSFGLEDQVITHVIFSNSISIQVATLDTGRLFKETYKVFNKTLEKYKSTISVYYPNNEELEAMVSKKGPYSFYNSVEDRKECCTIRKVNPLQRALHNKSIWITGIRAEQSPNRQKLQMFEYDEDRSLIKCNILIDWTFDQVQEYIKKHQIPYNSLHDKGFVSIGCEPCTRAIQPGEDFRAGRWWWEDNSKKECGLHTHKK
ncbi:MAG: Thioredoxin-dependent 5'-adenylylsulfate reductase [Bacteroidetes bacterium ADurb.Bin217]|nr:MAG: Thioredoxin-dependent 5'-adenylylsulfate reductase [Bacteroidetes bacterium ADurb.Bin217]